MFILTFLNLNMEPKEVLASMQTLGLERAQVGASVSASSHGRKLKVQE